MYKEVLRAIAGIDTFPIISLLLFVITFAVVLVRVARMDRTSVERLAALPLEGTEPAPPRTGPMLIEGDHRGT